MPQINFLPPPSFETRALGTDNRWLIHYATVPHWMTFCLFLCFLQENEKGSFGAHDVRNGETDELINSGEIYRFISFHLRFLLLRFFLHNHLFPKLELCGYVWNIWNLILFKFKYFDFAILQKSCKNLQLSVIKGDWPHNTRVLE